MIEQAFGFWKERKLVIDCFTCLGDDHEWSTAEFREWRASRDACFLINLSILDSLDPRLLADILRDYTLKFKIKVESTLRDLRDCLTRAIRDKDCYKEIANSLLEDLDEMIRIYKGVLATFIVELE